MVTLQPLWTWLETRPDSAAVQAEWQAELGGLTQTLSAMLRPTDQLAPCYPATRPYGSMLEVVRHRDGRIVAVDPQEPQVRLELTEQDLVVYELDLAALRETIATGLDLQPSTEPIDPQAQGFSLGSFEPQPGRRFGVQMVRATTPGQLAGQVQLLVALAQDPALIVTPTRRFWSDGLPELCRQRRCLLVSLDQILALDGDRLVASDAWAGWCRAFVEQASPKATVPAPPDYQFTRRGSVWVLAFGGKTAYLVHAKGLTYLQVLLAHPHRMLPAAQVLAIAEGHRDPIRTGSGGERLDRQAFDAYRTRYDRLAAELAEAREARDAEVIERLEAEMAALAAELTGAQGLGRRVRQDADDGDRIRRAVATAIDRALGAMQPEHPELARHLRNAVSTGFWMAYRPEQSVPWEL